MGKKINHKHGRNGCDKENQRAASNTHRGSCARSKSDKNIEIMVTRVPNDKYVNRAQKTN